jgi:hypothetical protein
MIDDISARFAATLAAVISPIIRIVRKMLRAWASINFRYCCSNAYLATQRHEPLIAVGWSQMANDWEEQWRKYG